MRTNWAAKRFEQKRIVTATKTSVSTSPLSYLNTTMSTSMIDLLTADYDTILQALDARLRADTARFASLPFDQWYAYAIRPTDRCLIASYEGPLRRRRPLAAKYYLPPPSIRPAQLLYPMLMQLPNRP